MAAYKLIKYTINGRRSEQMIDVRLSLLELLRDKEKLLSVKKGCEVGECGACNVIVNGETVNSCIYLAAWIDGKEVITLEALSSDKGDLSLIQQAFVEESAVQCGFCTPGIIMSASNLLAKRKNYSRQELRQALSGHLCRCTGYQNILNAVEKAMHEAERKEVS